MTKAQEKAAIEALKLIILIQENSKISRTNSNVTFVDTRDLAAACGWAKQIVK